MKKTIIALFALAAICCANVSKASAASYPYDHDHHDGHRRERYEHRRERKDDDWRYERHRREWRRHDEHYYGYNDSRVIYYPQRPFICARPHVIIGAGITLGN